MNKRRLSYLLRISTSYFSLTSLFANGEQGFWFDHSDVANLDWRYNLLTYTEDFSNAVWVKPNVTVMANAAIAPDGTTTADKVIATNTASNTRAAYHSFTAPTTTTYTVSFYAKAVEHSLFAIQEIGGGRFGASFNLSSQTTASLGGAGFVSSSITSMGDGWFRCAVVWNGVASVGYAVTAIGYPVGATVSASGASYAGDGTSGILIWGAQLVTGSEAREYQKITNVATETIAQFPKATLYQDTAGTVPVTTPGQTVALKLDKSQGLALGPDLAAGILDSTPGWVLTGAATVASGELVFTTPPSASASAVYDPIVANGKRYEVRFTLSGRGTVNVKVGSAGDGISVAAPGTYVFRGQASGGIPTPISFASTVSAINNFVGSVSGLSVRLLPGNHATQGTALQRPTYLSDEDGKFVGNDFIDDNMTVTLPDLGTDATVAYVTRSEVRLLEGQTISGTYTLPRQELAGIVVIDRALTIAEKVSLIRYLASKVEGVNYGAEIDRLALIALNAVDVFVYDTSKDSDGGAWRTGALAQASSWYNETLNTATRGSRREFPAVAVIVVEAAKVTIYDGDDPALPMWMVFHGGGSHMIILGSGYSFTGGLFALNGVFSTCSVGIAAGGLNLVNLIADTGHTVNQYTPPTFSANYTGKYRGSVADRNSGLGFSASTGYLSNPIINRTVNDVAMTVLPDAPIDPATGLPVPTIAVATAGGVSVIKDGGTVVNITGYVYPPTKVAISGNTLWNSHTVNEGALYAGPLVFPADTVLTSWRYAYYNKTIAAALQALDVDTLSIPAAGGSGGVSMLQENAASPASGMSAFISSTYNTGWLPGNIKGAFLSETSITALVGSGESVTNGGFTTADLSNWDSLGIGTFQIVSGQLNVTAQSSVGSGAYHALTGLTAGSRYIVSWDVTMGTATIVDVSVTSSATGGGGALGNTYTFTTSGGSYQKEFVADDTDGSFNFSPRGVGNTASVDNVSVRLADADRSVNNKGLIVNGTITRTPVATGAELVAYSGFSAANYLEQPYNSALDFGTGDFCLMGWAKTDGAVGDAEVYFARGDNGVNANRFAIYRDVDDKVYLFQRGSSVGTATGGQVNVDTGQWFHFAVNRKSSSVEIYINGALDTNTSVVAQNVSNSLAKSYIGVDYNGISPANEHNLTLFRISATAPTSDQIAKIYADELPLFQPGAACTLYGTSDAVTALAHDPDTGLLHVGTSAGRSVFQGLQRIGNTTTSVTKAISASGGIIVEK